MSLAANSFIQPLRTACHSRSSCIQIDTRALCPSIEAQRGRDIGARFRRSFRLHPYSQPPWHRNKHQANSSRTRKSISSSSKRYNRSSTRTPSKSVGKYRCLPAASISLTLCGDCHREQRKALLRRLTMDIEELDEIVRGAGLGWADVAERGADGNAHVRRWRKWRWKPRARQS